MLMNNLVCLYLTLFWLHHVNQFNVISVSQTAELNRRAMKQNGNTTEMRRHYILKR